MEEVTVERRINSDLVEEWIERTLASQFPGGPYERREWDSDYGSHHHMAEATGTEPIFFGLSSRKTWSRLLSVWVIHGPGLGSKVITTLYRPELEQEMRAMLPAIGEELKARYNIDFKMKLEVSYPD